LVDWGSEGGEAGGLHLLDDREQLFGEALLDGLLGLGAARIQFLNGAAEAFAAFADGFNLGDGWDRRGFAFFGCKGGFKAAGEEPGGGDLVDAQGDEGVLLQAGGGEIGSGSADEFAV